MTCKHDWHFIHGTSRLECTRCGAETGPSTPEQLAHAMLHDVTTIGSAWSKGGERIDPMSVYAVPTEQLPGYKLHDSRPANTIQFYGGPEPRTEVLRISKDGIWANPEIPTDEAAKKVLEAIDGYVKHLLAHARKDELQACCDLLEGMHAATDGNHNYYLHAANELRKLRANK